MRLFRSHLLFKIGLYATAIHLSTTPRNSGIPSENSNAKGYQSNRIKCCSPRGQHRPNRAPNPENAGCMRRGCRIECLSVCGHYRPNHTPNPESAGRVRRGYRIGCCSVRGHYRPNRTPGTKRGVVAHVRTARQSRDCLRVRPSRAPPLFVAVRSALGPVLPTVARARWRHFVASPLRQSRFSRRKLAHPLASVRSMV